MEKIKNFFKDLIFDNDKDYWYFNLNMAAIEVLISVIYFCVSHSDTCKPIYLTFLLTIGFFFIAYQIIIDIFSLKNIWKL